MLTLIENTELFFFFQGFGLSNRPGVTIMTINSIKFCRAASDWISDAKRWRLLTKVVASAGDDVQPHSLSMPKANQFALYNATASSTFQHDPIATSRVYR